jgi:RNA recognition motif-containing protein
MESKYVSKTLFVGNLHVSLEENDLLNVFKPFGTVVECCKKVKKKKFSFIIY